MMKEDTPAWDNWQYRTQNDTVFRSFPPTVTPHAETNKQISTWYSTVSDFVSFALLLLFLSGERFSLSVCED